MVDLRKPFWLKDDGEGVEGRAKILLEIYTGSRYGANAVALKLVKMFCIDHFL
jgi:hypothetical protein